MKLASYEHQGARSYGIVTEDGVIDLGRRLGERYADLKSLLDGGLEAAADVAASGQADLGLDEVRLLPVIPNPGAVWCGDQSPLPLRRGQGPHGG